MQYYYKFSFKNFLHIPIGPKVYFIYFIISIMGVWGITNALRLQSLDSLAHWIFSLVHRFLVLGKTFVGYFCLKFNPKKNKIMNRELVFLRTFAFATVIGMVLLTASAFRKTGNYRFSEIDVERINIIEKDGTVKMIITNVERFPNGAEIINDRPTNEDRKKRSGMLFFNEDGIECGGFIYDGQKNENGHSAGLSLTYDQYDGDQVMQLLTQDYRQGDQRFVSSTLSFNDRPAKESQLQSDEIMRELEELGKKDPQAMEAKYKEYEEQGIIGAVRRVMLGKSPGQQDGLFLFDNKGKARAMFYVDKENNAKLDFYDGKGKVIASFPEQTK